MTSNIKSKNKTHQRISILLEVIPVTISVITLFLGQWQLFMYSVLGTGIIYLMMGWYIFKTEEYNFRDILFTELSILFVLFPSLTTFIYKILSWPGANEILSVTFLGILVLVIMSIIWFINYKEFPRRKILGLNILARVCIFLFLGRILSFILETIGVFE